MRLVFDSGSSKISVAIIREQDIYIIELQSGYNAINAPNGKLGNLIFQSHELMEISRSVSEIYYYGAGCATKEVCDNVRLELSDIFNQSYIEVESDMLGAARAVCGNTPGIVGILGTGSNSCMYDGHRITANVPPLGYILGDEGSGAVLGKRFIGMLLKEQLPRNIRMEFDQTFGLSISDVLKRVYCEPGANSFLASFAPFIAKCCTDGDVNEFVTDEFARYIRYNMKSYDGFGTVPIHFIGSIAENFSRQLQCALEIEGGIIGSIIRAPIHPLANFHTLK